MVRELWAFKSWFMIFQMDVKMYTISYELGKWVQPEQATRYVFEHPPYFPDLVPSDFHLFFWSWKQTGGMRFQSNEEVESWCHSFFQKLDP